MCAKTYWKDIKKIAPLTKPTLKDGLLMTLVKYRLDLLITDPYYYRPFSKFWNTRWSLQSRFLFTLREKCPNTLPVFLYSDWIQENAGQKILRILTLFTQCHGYSVWQNIFSYLFICQIWNPYLTCFPYLA